MTPHLNLLIASLLAGATGAPAPQLAQPPAITQPRGPLYGAVPTPGSVPIPGTSTPLNQTLIGPAAIVYGTCEWGTTYGTVESATLKNTGDKQEWTDCNGNTQVVLIRNQRYEVEFETLYDPGVDLPAIGDTVAFPDVGVSGNVIDVSIVWAKEDRKKLKVTATQWKSLGSSPTVTQLVSA